MNANGRLLEEHDALHGMLDDISHLVHQGGYVSAAKVFGEFRRLLELHVELEELLSRDAPMHATHERLRLASGEAWGALSHHDPHECVRAIAALGVALAWHERQERELSDRCSTRSAAAETSRRAPPAA